MLIMLPLLLLSKVVQLAGRFLKKRRSFITLLKIVLLGVIFRLMILLTGYLTLILILAPV